MTTKAKKRNTKENEKERLARQERVKKAMDRMTEFQILMIGS